MLIFLFKWLTFFSTEKLYVVQQEKISTQYFVVIEI